MSRMRYCEQCGSPLSAGVKFCDNCGAPVPEVRGPIRENQQARSGGVQQRRSPRREQPGGAQQPPRKRYEPGNGQVSPRQSRSEGRQAVPRQGAQEGRQAVPRQGAQEGRQVPPRQGGMAGSRQVPPRLGGAESRRIPQERYEPEIHQMPQGQQAPGIRYSPRQGDADRRMRYRQEELENDWQQSWDRMPAEEDEKSITPAQYVLIGITAVLLVALIVFGVFWVTGRSSNKDADDRNAAQTERLQTEAVTKGQDDAITILDGGSGGGQAGTEAEKQSETPKQTEAAQDTVLNYSEFSVTIPASWQGKYGVTQGAGYYSYYQKASKDKGYNGTLFTITRYTDTSYKDEPNYEVLGMGGGAAYIFSLPTDVQYAAEDAAVAEEYRIMSNEIARIKSGIKILVSGEGPKETEPPQPIEIQDQGQQAAVPSGGYIPESSDRLITDADVSGMSYDDMQMAINEIYARHGRIFTTPEIKNYFDSQPWYQGTVSADDFDESIFSSTEAQNIQFLLGKMGN